jgi:transposase
LLTGSENFAYDISAIVTRSSINIPDIGYNKEMSYAPQIELILISSTETKLPALVRIVSGSIRNVKTLKTSVKDIG